MNHVEPCVLQKAGRGKAQGEVMPTLDMTLFDWTDYEDMKPVDTWPSNRKKGMREPALGFNILSDQ